MFVMINKQTRPDKNVKFYFEIAEMPSKVKEHFYSAFISTGKFVSMSRELSNDGTTVVTKTYWNLRSSLLEYMTDEICYEHITTVSKYDKENGITYEISIEEDDK